MKSQRITAVIWDFNGTLIDDVDLATRSINTLLLRRNLAPLTVATYREVFGFPVADYYRAIGVDLAQETMTGLADEFHETYFLGLPESSLHKGVTEILEALQAMGVAQFILSAMEEGPLRAAIDRLGIADFFTGVYGLDHRLADSKIARGRELLDAFRIRAEDALFIGDTDHDAEVAMALGTSIILIAEGHQSAQRLRGVGCPVVDSFARLRETLMQQLSQ